MKKIISILLILSFFPVYAEAINLYNDMFDVLINKRGENEEGKEEP